MAEGMRGFLLAQMVILRQQSEKTAGTACIAERQRPDPKPHRQGFRFEGEIAAAGSFRKGISIEPANWTA
jgi:hypothetical protein